MAQHTSIEHFRNEKWYDSLKKAVSYWVEKTKHSHKSFDDGIVRELNSKISILPLSYRFHHSDSDKILSYKSSLKIDAGVEIHLNNNIIQEIYIVS